MSSIDSVSKSKSFKIAAIDVADPEVGAFKADRSLTPTVTLALVDVETAASTSQDSGGADVAASAELAAKAGVGTVPSGIGGAIGTNGNAAAPSTNTMAVGMNLSFVNYYGTQFAFIDRFKTSSEWMAQDKNWVGMSHAVALNANGYPKAMPNGAINMYTMVNLDPVSLPTPDVYVLTYTGTASISVTSGVILSSKPGEIVFRYTGDGNSTAINISSMDSAKPITDMHIVRQDQVALYNSGEIFNPAFLDKASQWSELRYMDWGNTNNSQVSSWNQRTTVNSASWGGNTDMSSVPIEIMVALANKTHTNMWINIPAEADDDYVRKTLSYVRDNLASGLTVKVEYSNEVWNGLFDQGTYSREQGAALWGTDLNGNGKVELGTSEEPAGGGLKYYGYRSAQIAAIGNAVFGASAATRLQNVISTQTVFLGTENYIFEGVRQANKGDVASLFKDYAITTYFGIGDADQATILSWAKSGQAGLSSAFSMLAADLNNNIRIYVYQQAVAARNGLELVAYEGGVGLTSDGFSETDQATVLAFYKALDNDPRMGDLYTKMVTDFAANGGSGLNPYADAIAPTKYGTWGTLDSIYDESSPRYDALVAASRSAKASQATGSDPTQVNVRTAAASYTLAANQLTLTYLGTGGFSGTGNDRANTIIGGNSFNRLYGGAGDDVVTGGTRNDIIDGGTGADLMTGGAGDDIYTVDNIGDAVVELADGGIDEIRTTLRSYTLGKNVENLTFTGTGAFTGTGNALDNVITASGNPATLNGGAGNDTLIGSVGADLLNGGPGADTMVGGMGDDLYYVDNVGDRITELAFGGIDTVKTSLAVYGLGSQLENLTYIGTGNFNGFGNAGDNIMIGGVGDDSLSGGEGNDTLIGGAGNDTLWGGTGADTMTGGLGNDRYDVDNVGDIVTELAGEGTDSVYSTITYTLTANVENLGLQGADSIKGYGNDLNNSISGNAGDNSLFGYGGDDFLQGGGGNDMLVGGLGDDVLNGDAGDDQLLGGAGDDYLQGGAGNDLLNGGTGKDVMTGGAGADRFVFLAGDTGATRATADTVYFSHADGDIIDLSKMDANTRTGADDAFSFVGLAAFTRKAGELRMQYSGGFWDIQGDTNGDGVADFSITVNAAAALIPKDFAL